ncbi:protein-methionine-sulfoxide reductase heme-binding subunit MsrQ [Thiolapillus brandeum]|uniref:Protein-methionine-sulfoxide reductase heme-binding subunit MsrQ n=1 Tax=Thiolapillus brandeum TaxID=1076588 RepID=A0A7U6GJ57_9GAMM|nr:protein-methionine-sulfoxide reductase heme-binding subunit MsrQ [Thiolapillus brandeum]BAO44595.1 sulfite oxidase subunit YedZ [Thiolapillus brandeum]
MNAWKLMVFVLCLLPLGYLGLGIYEEDLGPNPVEYLTHETGIWALRLLLLTLAITPLRRFTGWRRPVMLRRMLGLFSFFYACLHLLIWLWLDRELIWSGMFDDVLKRPYITVGFIAFLILSALAATSNSFSMQRLGRRWKRLHRFAYAAAALGILHYLWLVKADLLHPMIYMVVFLLLMGLRLPGLPERKPMPFRRKVVS